MNPRMDHLCNSLTTVFEGNPWYGDSVMEKLRKISFPICNTSPIPGTKTVAEVVKHMINWRLLVIEVLKGNGDYHIEVNSKEDWPDIKIKNAGEWTKLVDELKNTQNQLIELLSSLPDELLDQKAPGKEYTYLYLLEGIIQHDVYHIAQIAIVAKQAYITSI